VRVGRGFYSAFGPTSTRGGIMKDEYTSNLEQLQKAGIISDEGMKALSKDQSDSIERLSKDEVRTLIDVHEKVGPIEFGARLI
jgi:hypothetical protein